MFYEERRWVLPWNLPEGEVTLKKIKKLVHTARELGGTIYEVAEKAGLFSAERFFEHQFMETFEEDFGVGFHDESQPRVVLLEDMTAVTEVYVEFSENDPLDRIFLYSYNAKDDKKLLQEGEIRDRKLVIPFEKLSALHDKGYKCIYGNAPDGRNGKAFARYTHSFGEDRRLERYEVWDDAVYVGNGCNQALLVWTVFGTQLVMPDLHAVEESIKTYHAENLVRELYHADFCIERIKWQDEKVLSAVGDGQIAVLGCDNQTFYKSLPECYQKLVYQIAYIKVHYPMAYEMVWGQEFYADDERECCDIQRIDATLSVSLGSKEIYAMCKFPDGMIKRVPNVNAPKEMPLWHKYRFKGYGMIHNPGTSGSRMALALKKIKESAETFFGVNVQRVYLTHPEALPDKEQIAMRMQRRFKRALQNGNQTTAADWIAYEQVADKDMSGLDVIHWAAELAHMPEAVYVDAFDAQIYAFEQAYAMAAKTEQSTESEDLSDKEEKALFKLNKLVLLYHFDSDKLCLTLLKKNEDGMVEIFDQAVQPYPETTIFGEEDAGEECMDFSLQMEVECDVEEFMLGCGLDALGINRYSTLERDFDAFSDLRRSTALFHEQFRRCDQVNATFDNGYLNMVEEYPITRFEDCFELVFKKSEELFETLLERNGLNAGDISRLLLRGENTEYPFVREHIEMLVGKSGLIVPASECIEARGALFCGK